MKKNLLFSVAGLAKLCGVSRMTLHRHLKSGALRWLGNTRRGRLARGIALDDFMALVRQQSDLQSKSAGVEARMLRVMREQGVDWRVVMARMMAAAQGGADADLLLYATRQLLCQHNRNFLLRLVDDSPADVFADTAEYAAYQIRMAGATDVFDLSGRLFKEAWSEFVKAIRCAPVNAKPVLLYDPNKRCADIVMLPTWIDDCPLKKIKWHDSEADVSIMPNRRRRAIREIIANMAIQLSLTQYGSDGKVKPEISVSADTINDAYIKQDNLTKSRRLLSRMDLPAYRLYGLAVSAILSSNPFAGVRKLQVMHVSKSDAWCFARELRKMAGCVDGFKVCQFNNSLKVKIASGARLLSVSAMARALVVSRLTVSRWLAVFIPRHKIARGNDVRCLACGAPAVVAGGGVACSVCSWETTINDLRETVKTINMARTCRKAKRHGMEDKNA